MAPTSPIQVAVAARRAQAAITHCGHHQKAQSCARAHLRPNRSVAPQGAPRARPPLELARLLRAGLVVLGPRCLWNRDHYLRSRSC